MRYACRGDYRDGKLVNDTNGSSDVSDGNGGQKVYLLDPNAVDTSGTDFKIKSDASGNPVVSIATNIDEIKNGINADPKTKADVESYFKTYIDQAIANGADPKDAMRSLSDIPAEQSAEKSESV